MSRPPHTYVVAPTYHRYDQWCRSHGIDPYSNGHAYVHSTHRLHGVAPDTCTIILLQEWTRRRDFHDLVKLVRIYESQGARVLYSGEFKREPPSE